MCLQASIYCRWILKDKSSCKSFNLVLKEISQGISGNQHILYAGRVWIFVCWFVCASTQFFISSVPGTDCSNFNRECHSYFRGCRGFPEWWLKMEETVLQGLACHRQCVAQTKQHLRRTASVNNRKGRDSFSSTLKFSISCSDWKGHVIFLSGSHISMV